jgi:hypothetical protein
MGQARFFSGEDFMPITPFLGDLKFDSRAISAMSLAYEKVRAALGIVDRNDRLNEIIAQKVIELAQAGETEPDRLFDQALVYFRVQRL